ncbi:3-hydroxybutyrate oligomer hydrolase family protein [Pseudoteredinibacter isoporae]|uniref:3-hydroxybutyrate oligomer hydrolase family protein n=1 Tax=Pseudoteredinibacter isoporae TaxID=570281 RepID=UPI00310858BF
MSVNALPKTTVRDSSRGKTLASSVLLGTLGLSSIACSEGTPIEARLLDFKHSDIQHSYLDGQKDDLLSAGLGLAGLQASTQPSAENPGKLTEMDLRRAAIYNNYRAIVSTHKDAGYAKLYGPENSQKNIPGHEYRSSVHYPNGEVATNIVVQVPDHFQAERPCIIAAPSSGSRGVWGAIGTAGDWGLRHGCAVAYTDKGTGTGFQFLDNGAHYSGAGMLLAAAPDQSSQFDGKDLRIASRHAHSGNHIEKDWGRYTLQAVKMAFYLLNQHHRENGQSHFTRDNTTVIASSISNGGNSVVQAAELDREHWIDGVVASEPTLNLPTDFEYQVEHPNDAYTGVGRDILYLGIQHALYQPCAILASKPEAASIFSSAIAAATPALKQRCKNLKAAALLSGEDPGLAKEAERKLQELGMKTPSYSLQAFAVANHLWPSIAINYANAYGQNSAQDSLCEFSFVYQEKGQAKTMPTRARQALYGLSGGIPNTAGINLAYQGQVLNMFDPADPSFAGFQCLAKYYRSKTVQDNINALSLNGDVHGKPTLILHGNHDSLVGPNHNSRGYMALRADRFPKRDNVRYIEINHGQHFDALLSWPEFRQQLVPMHYYYERAMDAMWQHLHHAKPLPASQFINSQAAQPLTAQQLPAWSAQANIEIQAKRLRF